MTDATDDIAAAASSEKRRAVKTEAGQIGDDVVSLGGSFRELVEAHARDKPLQTVAIALAIGWLLGKRI